LKKLGDFLLLQKMIATTTVILSTAMISRAEAHETGLYGLMSRLTGYDDDSIDNFDDVDLGNCPGCPPTVGGLNQPCNFGAGQLECNSGLHCHYYTRDGSSIEALCKKDRQPEGGEGEPCRSGRRCNSGLVCVRKQFVGGPGHADMCERPSGGNHGDQCGAGHPHCNPGLFCKTKKILGGPGYAHQCEYVTLGDSKDSDSNDDDKKLGQRAPIMGGENQPCRNGYDGQPACNWGLECSYYTLDGSSIDGTCQPSSSPSPSPSGHRGDLNHHCTFSGTCYQGSPRWEHEFGQGLEVCMCRGYLGATNEENTDDWELFGQPLGATNEDDQDNSDPKLGVLPPIMGGLNQPCRNTKGDECNPGFYCDYTVDHTGSTIFGTCKKRYTPDLGRLGQGCRNTPGNECDAGLYCHYWSKDGTSIEGTCEKLPINNKAKEGDKCGSSADFGKPRTCASGLFCRSRQLLGCQPRASNNWSCTTHLCEKPPLAQKGEKCGSSADFGAPRSCASGLYCKTQPLYGCQYGPCTTHLCSDLWVGDAAQAPGN